MTRGAKPARLRPAVHQFHQGIRSGDAIGDEMLALRKVLRAAGYDSQIFVEQLPSEAGLGARDVRGYFGSAETVLLVHHSIGHRSAGIVAALPDRKFLVYHNITPTRFFAGNPTLRHYARLGRRQLGLYRDRFEGAFADSEYNAAELRSLGFEEPKVLPPVFALQRFAAVRRAPARKKREPTVLFVGRIAENKRQTDLVEAFDELAAHLPDARLLLAGPHDEADPYARRVIDRIQASPHRERIRLLGSVSPSRLMEVYGQADLFVSMSEHEGFGLPLLEAFASGVPVLAYDAGAVPETLGGAGVLFARKDVRQVAAMMEELLGDAELRGRIVADQYRRLERPEITLAEKRLLEELKRIEKGPRPAPPANHERPLEIRLEGPFETSYGLAVANRALGEALERHTVHRVAFHATEGPGDYMPRSRDLADKSLAAELWRRSFESRRPDVLIRNTYPPRFDRLRGRLNLSFFFWEDSLIPRGWAARFNRFYDGMLAPTRHVESVLRDSGVRVPIAVIPTPVSLPADADSTPPAELPTSRALRLLSVGSAFPRKGIDVLLAAYGAAFTSAEDVVLVLKTFPNIHNNVADLLRDHRLRNRRYPEVLLIDRDVPPEELVGLYKSAHALIHPSRAEGFGLPVAEAMLLGLPVIAPSSTGLADLCDETTALVIPHRLTRSASHVRVPGALWAEPDHDGLVALLRGFASGALREEAARRAEAARKRILERHSPPAAARQAAREIERLYGEKTVAPSVTFVSTWNCRCGIATYTEKLISSFPSESVKVSVVANQDVRRLGPDSPGVRRVWSQSGGDYDGIVNEVLETAPDVVHVQFHPGLFAEYAGFASVLEELGRRGVARAVTLHLLEDVHFYGRQMRMELLKPALEGCETLIAHRSDDLARLAEDAGARKVAIAHGGDRLPARRQTAVLEELSLTGRRVIASFGFAFPHKGVIETIRAVETLRRQWPTILLLALHAERPDGGSPEYLAQCRQEILARSLADHVVLIEDFLGERELAFLLSAAEVVVLPYLHSEESASGAVRYALGAGRPMIATRARIFDDVRDAVLQIPEASPALIAGAVSQVLANPRLADRLAAAARSHARRNAWTRVGRMHLDLYRGMLRESEHAPRENPRRLTGVEAFAES
ncbi:MAG: glycosyltransferase family 4 protein [Thermoanaerobaculia bacterium]